MINFIKFPLYLFLLNFPLFVFSATVDEVVAIVSSEPILLSDIIELKNKLSKDSFLDPLLFLGKTKEEVILSPSLQLDYIINEKILLSEIKRLALSVTSERVDQEIKEIIRRNKTNKDDLIKSLGSEGLTMSAFQELTKNRIERQTLVEAEILSKIIINDDTVMAEYLSKNPSSKTKSNEYTIAHIFLNPKKGGDDGARKRAEEALSKLKSGVFFESLAEQTSEDPDFSSGGLLGTFKAGDFLKEMESAVEKLEVGQVSPIVKSKQGYHILKLLNRKIISDPNFEASKETIRRYLLEERFQKFFKSWLETKREELFIKINVSTTDLEKLLETVQTKKK